MTPRVSVGPLFVDIPAPVCIRLCVEAWGLYSDGPMVDTLRYTTEGPVHGRCGHKHRSVHDAVDCLDAHEEQCLQRGAHTDRRIFAIGPGVKRDLNAHEQDAVARYRASTRNT